MSDYNPRTASWCDGSPAEAYPAREEAVHFEANDWASERLVGRQHPQTSVFPPAAHEMAVTLQDRAAAQRLADKRGEAVTYLARPGARPIKASPYTPVHKPPRTCGVDSFCADNLCCPYPCPNRLEEVMRDPLNEVLSAGNLGITGPVIALATERASMPDDAQKRLEYPMATGLLDYFPNALAEVARLSHLATLQHHPGEEMHWDRTKSTEHRDKIMRHLADTHTVDDKGIDHWAMVCWRALAGYQTYLEAKHGFPPSRASVFPPQKGSC